MSVQQKTYRLSPNWGFSPDGYITIGSIIKDPRNPQRPLYRDSSSLEVRTTKQKDFRLSWDRKSKASIGLRASIFDRLGAKFRDNTLAEQVRAFNFEILETQYIVPSDAEIARRVYTEDVVQYTDNKPWGRLYLITGVKIAYGATMETHNHGDDSMSVGVPMSAVTPAEYEHRHSEEVRLSSEEAFVFAYQLLEIKPKGDGRIKAKAYNDGALLNRESGASAVDESLVEKLQWEYEISAEENEGAVVVDELDCQITLE